MTAAATRTATGAVTLGRLDQFTGPPSEAVRAGVTALQMRAAPANVFHDAEVIAAATGLVGPVTLHWLERDGALLAALPVFARRLGLGLAGRLPHVLAHAFGPDGTPLVDPAAAAGDLARLIAAARGDAAALILPYAATDSAAVAALVAAALAAGETVTVLDQHRRAALDLTSATGRAPLAALSSGRRKEWARQARRLAERGAVSFRRDTAANDVAAALADVIALEARGWKGRRASALAHDARGRAFAEAVVTALAARGAVMIDRLLVGERTVAGLVSFRAAGRLWIWKTAYDEDFARFSPGVQLLLRVTDLIAADATLTGADSLATPDHPMIEPLWPDRLAMATLVIAPPGSGIGRRLAWELAATRRLRGVARRLLRR